MQSIVQEVRFCLGFCNGSCLDDLSEGNPSKSIIRTRVKLLSVINLHYIDLLFLSLKRTTSLPLSKVIDRLPFLNTIRVACMFSPTTIKSSDELTICIIFVPLLYCFRDFYQIL